jgi:hypothetical protein
VLSETQVQALTGFPKAALLVLVEFNFLTALDTGAYRVKGTKRYTRISEAKSKGGHAAKSNLIPGPHPKKFSGSSPAAAGEDPPAASGSRSEIRDPRSEIRDPREIAPEALPSRLENLLARIYRQVRREPFVLPRKKARERDEAALRGLLEHAPPELIAAKWLDALNAEWPHIASVKELADHWTRFSPAEPVIAQFVPELHHGAPSVVPPPPEGAH